MINDNTRVFVSIKRLITTSFIFLMIENNKLPNKDNILFFDVPNNQCCVLSR